MHIADMHLIGTGNNALGNRVRGADNQIVTRQIKLLDSERHQRQIGAIFLAREGKLLNEGRCTFMAFQESALA